MTSSPPDAPEKGGPADRDRVVQFDFLGFALSKLLFEHLLRVPPEAGETQPSNVNINIVLGAAIGVSQDQHAQVSMGMTVTPDPKWQPYKIEIEVVGRFRTQNGTPEDLQRFCQRGVPPILFPYMREIIHRVTMDGQYGPVRLNPLNVQSMLNQTDWHQTVAEAAAEINASQDEVPGMHGIRR